MRRSASCVLALAAAVACADDEDAAEQPQARRPVEASRAELATEARAPEPSTSTPATPSSAPPSPSSMPEPAVRVPAVVPMDQAPQILSAKTKDGDEAKIQIQAPSGWEIAVPPSSPDPHGGKFTLEQALAGLSGTGTLVARIQTSLGSLFCDLFEKDAPRTVANFVGLARGKRKFWDEAAGAWVARPYYDGTTFYRMAPGTLIQGGDHARTGRGRIGYDIEQEISPTLKYDRAGRLGMLQRGRGRSSAPFFVIEAPGPHLDGQYSLFGQCAPLAVIQRIARVPQSGPPEFLAVEQVVIQTIEIRRVPDGAAGWLPAGTAPMPPSVLPPGKAIRVDAPATPQGR